LEQNTEKQGRKDRNHAWALTRIINRERSRRGKGGHNSDNVRGYCKGTSKGRKKQNHVQKKFKEFTERCLKKKGMETPIQTGRKSHVNPK